MPKLKTKPVWIQCPVPIAFAEALNEAAKRDYMTRTEFVRRALIDRLAASGLDPRETATPHRRQPASVGRAA